MKKITLAAGHARRDANPASETVVGHEGIEPSTARLKGGCSTTELMAHYGESYGWGGRIRTCAYEIQSLAPYRLATPHTSVVKFGVNEGTRTPGLQIHSLAL